MKELFEMQMPKIKAIKIDVEKQSIYEIEIDNTLQAKYDAIGNDCRLIEVGAYFKHTNILRDFKDVMYVDEESLLKNDTREKAFKTGIFKLAMPPSNIGEEYVGDRRSVIYTFVGNAIIVGTSNDGDTESHNVSLRDVHERVLGFHKEN